MEPMTIFDRMLSETDFFTYFQHILNFQLDDLKRGLDGKANFLVATGCMNTIEFLGGLCNGELGLNGRAESRFKEGIRLLGQNIGVQLVFFDTSSGKPELPLPEILPVNDVDMWTLRCGLTHQYLPKVKRVGFIWIGAGKKDPYRAFSIIDRQDGVARVEPSMLIVDVAALFEAIERSCQTLFTELHQDKLKRERAQRALSRVPELM
jgi:hypothetical protein